MQILCLFLLVVAVPALATTYLHSNNCIVGCKCHEANRSTTKKVKIADCDSPLTLSASALADISKKNTVTDLSLKGVEIKENTVTALSLKGVEIKVIEKDTFKGFDNLEAVIIEDSYIGSIHPSAFDWDSISTISFTKTTFGEIPNLTSKILEELIFKDCKLTEVPNVDGLPRLSFLNLANNRIKTIDEMTFMHNIYLEEITLANNSISILPRNLFINNTDFNALNVDNNPLETFNLNLKSELELLSLRSCHLTLFDRNTAAALDSLISLDLSGNQIRVLPIDVFEGMEDLTDINLSNNQLVEVDDDIFLTNSKLNKIILDDNQFLFLPNFQTNAKKFETSYFSCKNCGLKSVQNSFKNMPDIEILDLSHNRLKDIKGVFSEITNLQQLDLSHNAITAVGPDVFLNNTNLKTLNLSNNPLTPLDPVIFAKIKSLQKLDVSNSSLLQLWTNRDQALQNLEYLVLANNNITVISEEDVKITPQLKLLDLTGNPILCTPELFKLLVYVKMHAIQPIENSILKTHEIQTSELNNDDYFENPLALWKKLAANCNMDSVFDDEGVEDNDAEEENGDILDDKVESSTKADVDDEIFTYYFEDGDYDNDEGEEGDQKDDSNDLYLVAPSILEDKNLSLARASYILSITSVFILTALVVLTIAVAITLLILKKNKSFNMHNGNLPRLKIPLWHNTLGQKKHSGSVYKPLSEEYSGPRTPIINRYEFKQTPQVHNSIP